MRHAKLIITFFLPVVALVGMPGCAHEKVAASPSTATTPAERALGASPQVDGVSRSEDAPASDPTDGEELGDAKILEVAHDTNAAEVAQAKVAERRARDPRVRDFAKMMVRMHGDAELRGEKIAAAENIQPAVSATSAKLEADAQRTLTSISEKEGAALDSAYMTAQIAEHTAVLKLLDEKLIPGATDPNVKALVEQLRPVVAKHLAEALVLQRALKAK